MSIVNILVINAGSSSLKYQLINIENERVLAKGVYDRIGTENSVLTHKMLCSRFVINKPVLNHLEAVKTVLDTLASREHGVVANMSEIGAVGHRVVHGGEKFSQSLLLTDEVMRVLKENISLAPLHNPANIMGIEACMKHIPNVPMAGVFDTAYHHTIPPKAFLYAIPMEAYKKYKVRRYGFHGTSHHYVADRVGEILGKDIRTLRIITCHLGSGSSIAAIKHGKVIDTSMGFTPLEGVAMGTRSGDIDPGVLQYLMDRLDMTLTEAMAYLNKQSGVLGISGISSDFRDLFQAMEQGNKNAKLAVDVYCYRVKKYIGAYIAAMGGADVIAFTAGIGENVPQIRQMVIDDMDFLETKLDKNKNNIREQEAVLTNDDSKVTVMVVPTNEELMIARETYTVCRKAASAHQSGA